MQAMVKRRGEWTVVTMKGRVELEKTAAFREACLKSLLQGPVIFEMSSLQFVGSTGMTEFFQCLADVQNVNNCDVSMVGLSEDFKRFVTISSAATIKAFGRIEEAFSSNVSRTLESLAVSDLKID